jgi:phytoene dehydrogenase-like protein
MKYDVVVVGGGIAGLTAAAYLVRSGKSVILIEKQSKTGGLVQTFQRNGVYFDGGLRSVENSGIVFPMLKQLGIDIEFNRSTISLGIEDRVIEVKDKSSIAVYEDFLKSFFPENSKDIAAIIREIRKIMGYMDVLYGVDNPAFMDIPKNKKYLFTELLPWLFKFLLTIGKIQRLNEPAEDYLKRFTTNQALIDMIAQHFFQKTPASFALSYFSLYLDYYYPSGGTATVTDRIADYIKAKNGVLKTDTTIAAIHPEQKYVEDTNGIRTEYDHLVWASDMKQLYNVISLEEIHSAGLARIVEEKRNALKDLHGSDSVFTVYMTVEENKAYFKDICTGHFFYTPDKRGLSIVSKLEIENFISDHTIKPDDTNWKNIVRQYITDYFKLNTFEIAIPVLRDEKLAPEDKTGVVVSLLFDFTLAKKIDELGWTDEMKVLMENLTIEILNESIFPGMKDKVLEKFSSSPLTIHKLTSNTEGAIVGWAFTNAYIPSVNHMLHVAKSVLTPLPDIFQAGQWVYSPAGLPISILTGKLAADKVLKSKKKNG